MHRDPKQWAYIRRLIMEEGHSRKGVSRMTGLNRTTIRRMLRVRSRLSLACRTAPTKNS